MPLFSFFFANQLIFPYAYVALFIDSKSSFYEGPVYSLINWHFLMDMTRHLSIVKVYFMKVSFFVGITHEPFQATAQSTSSPGPSPRSYKMALRILAGTSRWDLVWSKWRATERGRREGF